MVTALGALAIHGLHRRLWRRQWAQVRFHTAWAPIAASPARVTLGGRVGGPVLAAGAPGSTEAACTLFVCARFPAVV